MIFKHSLNLSVFIPVSSFAVLLQESRHNLDGDFLVCTFVSLGVANTIGSGADSGAGSSAKVYLNSLLEIICF